MVAVIWSTSGDTTADLVQHRLAGRRAAFIRVDTDAHGDRQQFGWDSTGVWFRDSSGRLVSGDEIASVYYRRPMVKELTLNDRDFANHETWYFGRAALLCARNARWMNHPKAVLLGENKLRQLELARRVGLTVPQSILTCDPMSAFGFYQTVGRRCVCKPGFAGLLQTPGAEQVVYAWRVPGDFEQSDFDGVRACPTLLQAEVKKTADIRVTVVGEDAVAVRITADDPLLLDWRSRIGAGLRYERVAVPSAIDHKLQSVMREMRLEFGAFDFAEATDGDWVFFEVNPSGQWGWLEEATGAPIAEAIAGWLSGAHRQHAFE